MDINEKIEYWLDLAVEDFITAEIVLKSKRFLYNGFLCHLVVEKLIKAYYWKNIKSEPPFGHNLLVLSKKSELEKILDENQKKLLFQLMPLNIEARYPTDKAMLSKKLTLEYSESIFNQTKEFLEWMKKLLEK